MRPIQLQSLKLLSLTENNKVHFKENTLFDPKVKVTRNVAQYPLHHVVYATTKFKVATLNGLGGEAFTRNITFLKKKAGITKQ